ARPRDDCPHEGEAEMSKMGELAVAVEIAERIDAANAVSRRRTSDPLTSHLAAKRVGEFEQQVSERILAVMAIDDPAEGCYTTHEIAQLAGLREDQVHKRMPELERHAKVTVHCDA